MTSYSGVSTQNWDLPAETRFLGQLFPGVPGCWAGREEAQGHSYAGLLTTLTRSLGEPGWEDRLPTWHMFRRAHLMLAGAHPWECWHSTRKEAPHASLWPGQAQVLHAQL